MCVASLFRDPGFSIVTVFSFVCSVSCAWYCGQAGISLCGGVCIWSNNPSERVLVLVSEGALCT